MAYTAEQLAALKAAAAKGVRTVTVDGHSVTYASVSEMLRMIAVMEKELAAAAGTARPAYFNPSYSKGV